MCRFFPGHHPAKLETWYPQYRNAKGGFAPLYSLKVSECPRSTSTPELMSILDQVAGALIVGKATGAAMHGGDIGKWPAWWYDAVGVYYTAKQEAELAEASA